MALFTAWLCLGHASAQTAGPDPGPGWPELYRLDRLPAFKTSVKVASISSYDRTGGNDDGFSGKYSFVREEANGLVIADLQGPGVIYRIWTPTPTDDLVEFYFDGESAPRLQVKFRDLFLGQQPPFVAPVVGYGAGGFYSYVPLPFQKSCKVLVRAKKVQFYQINYAQYGDAEGIESYTAAHSAAYMRGQSQAQTLFSASGSDISRQVVPPGSGNEILANRVKLPPGKPPPWPSSTGPGGSRVCA